MEESDLKRCDELMGCRDHWQLNTEDFNKKNLYALADEVPGLVEEVRRLSLQNGAMRRALTDVMQFSSDERSKAVAKGILDAHGGPDLDCIVKPLCEHKTVPTFDGLGVRLKCQLCGEYISE